KRERGGRPRGQIGKKSDSREPLIQLQEGASEIERDGGHAIGTERWCRDYCHLRCNLTGYLGLDFLRATGRLVSRATLRCGSLSMKVDGKSNGQRRPKGQRATVLTTTCKNGVQSISYTTYCMFEVTLLLRIPSGLNT
ncbi:unnamed protein product, partial [Scytosiphon promiscuus]